MPPLVGTMTKEAAPTSPLKSKAKRRIGNFERICGKIMIKMFSVYFNVDIYLLISLYKYLYFSQINICITSKEQIIVVPHDRER